MKCKVCGAEVAANMKFCGSCGAPAEKVETPVAETVAADATAAPSPTMDAPKAPAKTAVNPLNGIAAKAKKFIKPAIAVVAVVIVAAVAWNFLKPAKYGQTKASMSIQQVDDVVVVKVNGKQTAKIEGYQIRSNRSLDNTKAVILVSEDQAIGNSDGYELYTQDGKLITDGVYMAQISLNGGGIAFVKEMDYNSYPGVGELCLYANGKTTTVTSECIPPTNTIILSPDGKTVAYTIADGDKIVGYYYDGKAHELGKDVQPVAVADGAKYVYYTKNGNLYVQPGANSDKKETLGKSTNVIIFNRDFSQAVYTTSTDNGQKVYISRNGGAKASLKGAGNGSGMGFVTPDGTAVWQGSSGVVYDVGSFADTFYSDGNNRYYINDKFEATSVVSNVDSAQLANDGKTITYMKSGSVYQINGKSEKAEKVEIVDGDVSRFIATADGKAVFFVNEDYEVYYQKGKGKPVKIGDDFSEGYRYSSSLSLFQGKTLFYISDDEVFSSSGAKGVAVKGLDGYVQYVSAGMLGVTIQTEDGGETITYYSTDGKKFESSN